MNHILYISLIWIAFGIAGLFGFQFVTPKKNKGKPWTKDFIRYRGLSLLMLAIPWLLFYLLFHEDSFEFLTELAILIACALPSIIFDIHIHNKYKKLLKEESVKDSHIL